MTNTYILKIKDNIAKKIKVKDREKD